MVNVQFDPAYRTYSVGNALRLAAVLPAIASAPAVARAGARIGTTRATIAWPSKVRPAGSIPSPSLCPDLGPPFGRMGSPVDPCRRPSGVALVQGVRQHFREMIAATAVARVHT